jgi:glycosyltransferase involved in cell wall biosynthesis
MVYSSAEVFVIPSLQEAFGQTALESMACGTPVVGSDAGGIPEVVRDGVTGLLSRAGESLSLRDAILRLLNDSSLRSSLGANCREIAVREYALEMQARNYVDLYEDILREG